MTEKNDTALQASYQELLEMLVQLLEEVVYPLDMLIPAIEDIIARAEILARPGAKEK